MELTKRKFLKTAGAAIGAAALGPLMPKTAWSANTLQMGEMRIDTLSDGNLVMPGSFYFGDLSKADVMPILKSHGLDYDQMRPDCNLTLMRDGERTVLFDVGSGPDFMPSAGKLEEALDTLGVSYDDITHVVLTHAHPDHLWGLLDDFDDPLFSNAEYLVGKSEWEFWTDPNAVDTLGEERAVFVVGAQRRFEAIEDAVTLFDDGQEILPGIAARGTFGHTPGHMSFELRNGSEALMVIGDAITNHHIAFANPKWPQASDQDPELGAATRAALIDQIATEQMPFIGFHFPEGGLGRAERKDGAYIFTSEV